MKKSNWKLQKKSFLNKRGMFSDMPFLVVFLVVFFISIFFTHRLYTEINTSFDVNNVFQGDQDAEDIMTRGQTTINGFDYIFIMSLVLIAMLVIGTAFFIDTHPIFFFITLPLLIGILVVGGILGNAMEDFTSDSQFANETSTYPMASYVFDNYPLFILVIIVISGLVFYAKLSR